MSEDLEQLKQRLPLLEYLRRHNWTGHHVGAGDEFVGLYPLHPDQQSSSISMPARICSIATAVTAVAI